MAERSVAALRANLDAHRVQREATRGPRWRKASAATASPPPLARAARNAPRRAIHAVPRLAARPTSRSGGDTPGRSRLRMYHE